MATRRPRIRGIMNIPPRRKAPAAPTNEEAPVEAVPKEQGEPNLTFAFEIAHVGPEQQPALETSTVSVEKEPQLPAEEVFTEPLVEPTDQTTEEPLKEPEEAEPEDNVFVDPKPDEVVPVESQVQPNPAAVRMRRFLKPVVSLKARNVKRAAPPTNVDDKAKDDDDNHHEAKSNNKIIILNEIITHSDGYLQPSPVPAAVDLKLPGDSSGNGEDLQGGFIKAVEVQPEIRSAERDVKRQFPTNVTTPENEYPVPPPSPSKLNRARIKAVPRLGQRHTSCSASESEADESGKSQRRRNDSVCSTASGFQDNVSTSECLSPQKREYNSVIQRKCRRTEHSRKLAEARRDFYLKFGNNKPDRQKLTMMDLIFYNPTTNPMSPNPKNKKEKEETEAEPADDPTTEPDEPPKSGSDEENEIPAPQIKIGPNGEIVLDEKSLVVENKKVMKDREELMKSKVLDRDMNYGVYKRAKRSKDWSMQETVKFYKALNTIGTDFSLMCEFFPRRSRRELKMKFKKEERINRALIDRAVMQPCGFDFNELKHQVDMEEKELAELEKQKRKDEQRRKEEQQKREQELKKEAAEKKEAARKRKNADENPPSKLPKIPKPTKEKKPIKPLDITNVLDESDADISEVESEKSDDDIEDNFLHTIQRPTRSGRVPKILSRYKDPGPTMRKPVEMPKPVVHTEPGSLMVLASTGPEGEPVYKVFMVTGNQARQPVSVGGGFNGLTTALQCRPNGGLTTNNMQNIFTLTTSVASEGGSSIADNLENNITIPVENNITIPAENNITIPAENNITISEETNSTIAADDTIPEENNVTIPADNPVVIKFEDILPENNVTIPHPISTQNATATAKKIVPEENSPPVVENHKTVSAEDDSKMNTKEEVGNVVPTTNKVVILENAPIDSTAIRDTVCKKLGDDN